MSSTDEAEAVVREWLGFTEDRSLTGVPLYLAQLITRAIDAAVLAERERCAKVAEKHAAGIDKTDPIDRSLLRAKDAARATAEFIAADIRGRHAR